MKYLVSGIVGFVLTLAVSLPFQNLVKQNEAKAFAVSMKNKIEGNSKALASSGEVDIKIQPIFRLEDKKDEPRIKFFPQYPAEAAAQKIEGFVTLSFRVSKDGSVQNLRVTESSPPQVFDDAAVAAVSKWNFSNEEKKMINIQQKLRLNFNLGRTVAVEQRLTDSGF
jgi:TonB family protein